METEELKPVCLVLGAGAGEVADRDIARALPPGPDPGDDFAQLGGRGRRHQPGRLGRFQLTGDPALVDPVADI